MSKPCPQCEKKTQEQKHKIELLETRLKDVLRAYKVINKERDDLQAINASITSDVDLKQQKRLAELEENVLNMSAMVGKFELARKKDKDEVKRLEQANRTLQSQLESLSHKLINEPSTLINDNNQMIPQKNKASQTDSQPTKDSQCQTELFEIECEKKALPCNESRAIVAPIQREAPDYENNFEKDSEDDNFRSVSPNLSVSGSSDPEEKNTNSGMSLFYANELARKDIDLAKLRLRIREFECATRELEWKYNSEKYRLQARITDLENLNSTLFTDPERSKPSGTGNVKTTSSNTSTSNSYSKSFPNSNSKSPPISSGPTGLSSTVNVAYIKNVLTKLLETKDKNQKQVMINALITALNTMQ